MNPHKPFVNSCRNDVILFLQLLFVKFININGFRKSSLGFMKSYEIRCEVEYTEYKMTLKKQDNFKKCAKNKYGLMNWPDICLYIIYESTPQQKQHTQKQ